MCRFHRDSHARPFCGMIVRDKCSACATFRTFPTFGPLIHRPEIHTIDLYSFRLFLASKFSVNTTMPTPCASPLLFVTLEPPRAICIKRPTGPLSDINIRMNCAFRVTESSGVCQTTTPVYLSAYPNHPRATIFPGARETPHLIKTARKNIKVITSGDHAYRS